MKGESAQTPINDKGQKGEPGLDGVQGMNKIKSILYGRTYFKNLHVINNQFFILFK